jgi:protein transport protein SEC61 subunit gamma and related proteins
MGLSDKIKEFATECWRVLRITKRPNKEEFLTIVKVAGLGILIIGFIGFILHMINQLFILRAFA